MQESISLGRGPRMMAALNPARVEQNRGSAGSQYVRQEWNGMDGVP